MTDKERALKIIEDIATFLNEGSEEARSLWNILTVLRGSDNGNEEVKQTFTAPFRNALGIKPSNEDDSGQQGQYCGIEKKKYIPPFVVREKSESWHFVEHYCSALGHYKKLYNKPFYEELKKQ